MVPAVKRTSTRSLTDETGATLSLEISPYDMAAVSGLPECDARRLFAQIQRHEGVRAKAYRDSVGVWTVGVGHTGRDVRPNAIWTAYRIAEALVDDVRAAHAGAKRAYGIHWHELNPRRRAALINMAFNLGAYGLSRFRKMLAAMQAEYWQDAEAEALDSRWARQVGRRANELAAQISTGEWQEEFFS